MTSKKLMILTHGGAGSKNEYKDGTRKAAQECLNSLDSGAQILDAVCQAVAALENDSRFNAGIGSHCRAGGSVQMDASIMDSSGAFGAVAAVEGFKNPIYIARAVSQTPYRVLAGTGAAEFAGKAGFETLSPEDVRVKGQDFSSTDTVGCVAFDGKNFAAGLSTGGIHNALPGRVGDVPLIGCGLYAGPKGAVAATGSGEAITMKVTALRAYSLLEEDEKPEKILQQTIGWFDSKVAFGLLLVSRHGYAGGSNRTMAWSVLEF